MEAEVGSKDGMGSVIWNDGPQMQPDGSYRKSKGSVWVGED